MSINKYSFGLIFILLFIGVIGIASAQVESLGTFKQGQMIVLKQICASCTYNNITSVSYPNGSIAIFEQAMLKEGSLYTYNYNLTTQLGEYIVTGIGDLDSTNTIWSYSFYVTPTGNERITSGESLTIIGAIFVLFLVGGFFFILGLGFISPALKIVFIGLSVIILIISILFTLLTLTQTIGGYSDLVEGYSNFWFVMSLLVGVGILTLVLFALITSYQFWMKKRGFRD